MSQFQDAMHDFVQASNQVSNIQGERRSDAREEMLQRELAAAGDRLESVLRQMMRDEVSAIRDQDGMSQRGWPF